MVLENFSELWFEIGLLVKKDIVVSPLYKLMSNLFLFMPPKMIYWREGENKI